jgi:hypothetical protein
MDRAETLIMEEGDMNIHIEDIFTLFNYVL